MTPTDEQKNAALEFIDSVESMMRGYAIAFSGGGYNRKYAPIETIRAALAPSEPMGWQDISTCPSKGEVMLYRGIHGICIWSFGLDDPEELEHGATHWMPLPSAPPTGAA